MKLLNLDSISKKLTLLILFAVMPCLAILLYSGIELRLHLIKDAQSNVSLISHNMALAQKEISESTKQILSTLSRLPMIQAIDSTASSIILRAVLEQNHNFINISLVDPSGEVQASSSPFTRVNFSDRKHVKDAIEKHEFAVGEYIFTRIGTVTPGFTFAYPVLDTKGKLKAVLAAAVRLDIFSKFYDVETLPEKSFVAVTDHKGIRLFYYPAQKDTNPVGKPIKAGVWDAAAKGEVHGFFSTTGSDGLRRIVAYEKVCLNQEAPPYLYVWAGIPEAHILKAADASLIRNLLLMLLGTVISLTLSWVIAKNTLISPIQSLVDLTRKFSQGNLEDRCELSANTGEVGMLTKSFYDMAESLTMSKRTLQENEERFKTLSTLTFEGILIHNNGVIIDSNAAATRMLDYTREELIGENIIQLCVLKEYHSIIKENIVKGFAKPYEVMGRKKDGTVFPVEIEARNIKEGNKIFRVAALRDLTARKQAEEALRESEEKYRHLIEKLDDIIWTVDLNLNITYMSPSIEKNLGFTPKERMVQNPSDQMPPSSYQKIAKLFIKELNREKEPGVNPNRSVRVEIEYFHKNGSTLWFENIISGLRDNNGILCGFHGVARDISERKFAEKEKIKAQEIAGEQKKLALVGQVAGKMAHDFNNILGIIMGNTELSLLDCKEEKTKKTLELIFEQTIRGKNLTKNLVAFAKDQEPKQEFFRISEKIDLVLSLLKKDLQGIELIKEDKAGVPNLLADPGMIEHAFVNLIQNSIHAVSLVEHPRIINRIYSLDDNICIEIEDNGCGIPKKHLENIFEPSFTLKGSKDTTGSYKRGNKGTGYGMANVKKYIEQHKGSISVESKFTSGTKFTISLPVIKKELTIQEKAEIQKENIYFDKYILLVEDEPAISGVQHKILSQEPCNHKVDIAHDGQVAMDLFERNEYDLISLDYILPGGINGMDVYDHVRKTNKTIPILFISGNIEFLESIKDLKQKDGNIDHLSKPCQNKDYVKSINELFERSLASQE